MVIKRNGELVEFSREKIRQALLKAYTECAISDDNEIDSIAIAVHCWFIDEKHGEATVEEIQDEVERQLIAYNQNIVARAYIRYRYKREVARNYSIDFIDAIGNKLMAKDIQNQNANVDEHSFGGRVGQATDELMKRYALDFCMSEKSKRNHLENRIYIHDLSAYAIGEHNCLSVPFDDLLANGFNTRQTDVRPANSINTAFQLVAVIFQLQSLMQFGR